MKKFKSVSFWLVYLWLGIFSAITYLDLLLGASNRLVINKYTIHNVLICFLINIIFFNLIKKKGALLVVSGATFLWSIVSHFVLQLHGSALCFTLFKNFKTAVSVMNHYHLSFSPRIIFIVLLLAVNVAVVLAFPKKFIDEYFEDKFHLVWKGIFAAFVIFYGFVSYKIANNNMSWAPFFIIEQRGYCSYLITDSIYCINHFSKPEGYDEALVPTDVEGWEDKVSDTHPDIIVILNETFSDITKYSDVKTDVNPLEALESIDNLYKGYCIVPNAGGGTNTSEYELLTSNSTALLSTGAPFNYINFEKHNDTIVSYLKNNDYETFAFHCYSKENYNRKIAYTAMGFDNIYLGPDAYEYHHKNGNRDWLDEDNYKDLIRVYNESSDSPKFMYLLTYQNHGGYEQNDPEMDTVHSIGEYEVSNDIVDEYESSVKLSAEAFKELTDYYSKIDRPVIICMLGDHTFSYSTSLSKEGASQEEKEIDDRTVPYLIWSNYDMDRSIFTEYTSMIDLLPSVLYSAGIELDDYYKQILNLHGVMPGKTTFGSYIDNDGKINNITNDKSAEDEWNKYLFAEYKRLTK
ncbi:Phosphoglycerol transferase MdoB [Pseudobutyrivibrio sp. 49]|uniref:LTA synthase family protein n=1 Tax=Pseudobutyrivibrio sp. 49 TaxID=1855344 RepID=UPI00087E4A5A|nr:LTA synthase family protein [Pseudobutyrivibrio sp. 49]SDI71583.1 Phosphoglycerol transferase MdoB [Pseudobutyrivibrio sp. 49]